MTSPPFARRPSRERRSWFVPRLECCLLLSGVVPLLRHVLSRKRIALPAIGGEGTCLLVPPAPLRTPFGKANPSTLGCMADDDIPWLPLRIGKGVVTNTNPRSNGLTLLLGNNPGCEAWIVPGRDQHLLKNWLHPLLLRIPPTPPYAPATRWAKRSSR